MKTLETFIAWVCIVALVIFMMKSD